MNSESIKLKSTSTMKSVTSQTLVTIGAGTLLIGLLTWTVISTATVPEFLQWGTAAWFGAVTALGFAMTLTLSRRHGDFKVSNINRRHQPIFVPAIPAEQPPADLRDELFNRPIPESASPRNLTIELLHCERFDPAFKHFSVHHRRMTVDQLNHHLKRLLEDSVLD